MLSTLGGKTFLKPYFPSSNFWKKGLPVFFLSTTDLAAMFPTSLPGFTTCLQSIQGLWRRVMKNDTSTQTIFCSGKSWVKLASASKIFQFINIQIWYFLQKNGTGISIDPLSMTPCRITTLTQQKPPFVHLAFRFHSSPWAKKTCKNHSNIPPTPPKIHSNVHTVRSSRMKTGRFVDTPPKMNKWCPHEKQGPCFEKENTESSNKNHCSGDLLVFWGGVNSLIAKLNKLFKC